MNLQIVPARTGLHWATQGVRTFWRQPLAMSGLFFLFMATVSLVSIVPFIGGALALVLLPALTLGMMLSLSRQTTNQAVSALASQGLVRVAYGRIEVLDRVRLMEAAALSDTERQILAQLRASERR